MRVIAVVLTALIFTFTASAFPCHGQDKSKDEKAKEQLKVALSRKTVQRADIDNPTEAETANCRIVRAAEVVGLPGYVVLDNGDRKIRQYLDTNDDNSLDTWQFFKNGSEVYREIDTSKDNKPDEYRWFGAGGTRWGIDENKDGTIDRWREISAEEVANEVFQAVRARDANRFKAVLLSDDDLQKLSLGEEFQKSISKKTAESAAGFSKNIGDFKAVSEKSEFEHFGGSGPNLLAPEFDRSGNRSEVFYYDNASAVFADKSAEKKSYGQIALGTLVRTSGGWRVVELPVLMQEGRAVVNGGIFNLGGSKAFSDPQTTDVAQLELLKKYEALDKELRDAEESPETEKRYAQLSEVFVKLAIQIDDAENKSNWVRQMTDTIVSAYSKGLFPKGLDTLEAAAKELSSKGVSSELDYIAWQIVSAQYTRALGGSPDDRAGANKAYENDIEKFAKDFPTSNYAAEGLFNIAMNYETSTSDDEAIKKSLEIYKRIETNYPKSAFAARAKGAQVRLSAIGEKVPFVGKTIDNQNFDLKNPALRGKVVVIQYWASWCDVCLTDFTELQKLLSKYKEEVVVVGANVDDSIDTAKKHLKDNPQFKWTQLWDAGGLNGPLASQLGVSILPLIVLVDAEGKVVDTGLSAKDLDRQIQRLLK